MQSLSVIKGFQKTGLPWFPLSPTVLMFLFLLSRRPSDMIDYIPFTNCALVEVMKKSELIIIMPRWHIWPVMQICHHFSCFISQYHTCNHWHWQYYCHTYLDLLLFTAQLVWLW